MDLTILVAVSVLPPILSAAWFYRRDRSREPLGAVVRAFLAGGLVVLVAVLAVMPLMQHVPDLGNPVLQGCFIAFCLAAIPEELAKYLFLRRHIRSHHCDEPMDGMVYGALVSLGFAAVENLLYVLQGGLAIGIVRAFTAVPMHASCGALMDLALARRKLLGPVRGGGLVAALAMPILLHGLYDWPPMAVQQGAARNTGEAGMAFFMNLAVLLVAVVMVRSNVKALRDRQGRERTAAG